MLYDLGVIEAVNSQIVLQRAGQGGKRRQADDLASEDRNPVAGRLHADGFKDPIDRVLAKIGDVHGYLDNALVLELDTPRLDELNAPTRLADGPGDLVGDFQLVRSKIDIVGDKWKTRPDRSHSGGRMEFTFTEVRFPAGEQQLVGHALELALSDIGQVDPVRRRC